MTRKIPDYLRLHQAETTLPKPRQLALIDKFWHSFAGATGWSLERSMAGSVAGCSAGHPVRLHDTLGTQAIMSTEDMLDAPSVSHESAIELAQIAVELTETLRTAEETIRKQEKRLAELERAIADAGTATSEDAQAAEMRAAELMSKAHKAVRPLKSAAAWQKRQQPLQAKPAEDWDMSGWTEAPLALASSWFYWDVLPDGMLACVIAEAHGQGYESAMIAATARSAWQSHCNYRHDPAKMLRRISDTLWQTNSGDQLLSCLYAQINPETGEGSIASAGQLSGIITGRYGYRPLVEPTQPIGACIDLHPQLRHLQLQRGESLFAYTPGTVAAIGSGNPRVEGQAMTQHQSLTQQGLADAIRRIQQLPLEEQLKSIRQTVRQRGSAISDRTILAVNRLSPVKT